MTFKVVILSARAANLIPCVQSVLANEPSLLPDHIMVVDDGASFFSFFELDGDSQPDQAGRRRST